MGEKTFKVGEAGDRVEIGQVPREVVPSPPGSYLRGRGRAFNVRPHPLRHDREECDRTIHSAGINHLGAGRPQGVEGAQDDRSLSRTTGRPPHWGREQSECERM